MLDALNYLAIHCQSTTPLLCIKDGCCPLDDALRWGGSSILKRAAIPRRFKLRIHRHELIGILHLALSELGTTSFSMANFDQ